MWYEALPTGWSWSSLWYDYVRCGCGGIRQMGGACPACGKPIAITAPIIVKDHLGHEHHVPLAFQGGEGRYEDYIYLRMLQSEWSRPITDADRFLDVAPGSAT
jgi:hypothetical protein